MTYSYIFLFGVVCGVLIRGHSVRWPFCRIFFSNIPPPPSTLTPGGLRFPPLPHLVLGPLWQVLPISPNFHGAPGAPGARRIQHLPPNPSPTKGSEVKVNLGPGFHYLCFPLPLLELPELLRLLGSWVSWGLGPSLPHPSPGALGWGGGAGTSEVKVTPRPGSPISPTPTPLSR